MGFIYGLAAVLIIFEGIIVQCEGGGATSSNQGQEGASTVDIEKYKLPLPYELTVNICKDFDFQTTRNVIRSGILGGTDFAISRLLQNRIILMKPHEFDGRIHEYYEHDDLFLRFGTHQELNAFFNRFGKQVKKIAFDDKLDEHNVRDNKMHTNIINHIKSCAKNLEELRIRTRDDLGFWKDISDEGNDHIFPEVKNFQILGNSNRNEFKLNAIFPKLESLTICGRIADAECLANVKNLKELKLSFSVAGEDQLEHIFKNNENMTSISFTLLNRTETMSSISKYLTKLKTLEVKFPGENFLLRQNNGPLCILPSVTHFKIVFFELDDVFEIENLSFDMPHLKKLTLNGFRTDGQIIYFINHFKELEILELFVTKYNGLLCIEALKYIKEFTTVLNETGRFCNFQSDSLENTLKNIDKNSKLQTLKLVNCRKSSYEHYKYLMKGINDHLKDSMKPTWTLSHGEQIGTHEIYLMFKRDPSTCTRLARNE